MSEVEVVPAQYSRSKGAPWFEAAYKKEVMVLGQGGISSWVSVLLARTGATLHTYDMDSFEEHNLNGAFATAQNIGQKKVDALQSLIRQFSPDTIVYPNPEKYTRKTLSSDIVISGFDNMEARKTSFLNWLDVVEESETPEKCLYIDGRLSATVMQIFCITGDNKEAIEKYKGPDILFDDAEVDEGDCTFRQTSHTAAIIAGHMVGFYTNFLQDRFTDIPAVIPFKWEYTLPFNFTKNG